MTAPHKFARRSSPLLFFAEVLEFFDDRLSFQFQIVIRSERDADVAALLKTTE